MTTIRAAQPGDESVWRRLWGEYCAFYKVTLGDDVTNATWGRILDIQSTISALVAEQDGVVVGFADYIVHPNTWSAGNVCYLEDLYVDPTVRGSGVGRALIDRLIEIGRENGWARVYWHTDAGNLAARVLYDSYRPADGFVRYSVTID